MNPSTKRRAAIGVALGLILGVGALAACSGGSSDSTAVAAGGFADSSAMDAAMDTADGASAAGEAAADMPMSGSSEAAASSAAVPEAPAAGYDTSARGTGSGLPVSAAQATDRQIIRTADVTLEIQVAPEQDEDGEPTPASATALAAATTRAAHAVRALANLPDAYVSGTDGHGATVTVTLRIPAGQYNNVMGRIAGIGDVTQQSESTTDVTGEMVDVASRLQTMQASVDRLRALMADATSMKDVIALESELSSREADLESLQRRQASLSDQVALSTIVVTVNAIAAPIEAAEVAPVVEKAAFVKGLEAGWRGLTAVGSAVAAVIGALLPFLLPLALLGVAGWFVTRSVRTKRGRAGLPAVAAGHPLDVGPDVAEVHHDADQGS